MEQLDELTNGKLRVDAGVIRYCTGFRNLNRATNSPDEIRDDD